MRSRPSTLKLKSSPLLNSSLFRGMTIGISTGAFLTKPFRTTAHAEGSTKAGDYSKKRVASSEDPCKHHLEEIKDIHSRVRNYQESIYNQTSQEDLLDDAAEEFKSYRKCMRAHYG